MEAILRLVDDFVNFEKLLKQTSPASPYYEIIKIYSSQAKDKLKTLLSTQKQEEFYDYIIHQKKKSKASKENMPEHEVAIDLGNIQIQNTTDLKIFFMISSKNAITATFNKNEKQIDLMILNNNNMIKTLAALPRDALASTKTLQDLTKLKCHVSEQHRQAASDGIDDLIYLLKIKNLLYEHIRTFTQ